MLMSVLVLIVLPLLLVGALVYALGYLLTGRGEPTEGAAGLPPEELRRRRRRKGYTRAMFIFWTLFLAAQRALSVYLVLLTDAGHSAGLKEGAGMTLVFVDPLGILLVLGGAAFFKGATGCALVPDKDLTALYVVGTSLLSAAAVYGLWVCSRHAFLEPPPEKPDPASPPPAA